MGPAAAGTSALTYGKIISTWFDRSRGMALSILACGAGLGSVVIPPFAEFLIADYGWRAAYFLLGACTITLGTIPVALILKDAPAPKATPLVPNGTKISAVRGAPAGAAAEDFPSAVKSRALTSYPFLTLLAVSAMIGVTYVGVLTHLVPLLTDRGLTAAGAARLLSVLGGAAVAGHLLIGLCLDRYPAARVTALMLTLSGVGVAGIGLARPGMALTLAVLFLGAALGADNGVMPYLVGRYFGLASYGEFLGYFMAASTLGAAGGALLMGRVFDRYHSYVLMTNFIAACSLAAAILVYLLPKPIEPACVSASATT
jgi:predicted MFS family arabinose efflux permease